MAQSFEAMVSGIVRDTVREAVKEELQRLPSLLPAAAPDGGWMEEKAFREKYGLKSRDALMAAIAGGTVERKALSARNHICRLTLEGRRSR